MASKWPSIKQQLQADKIAPDTALEKLVKDNQDFHVLAPEEANDDVELPPWLRVYWRKNHPDIQHSTVNPGGGYPDVLYTIYSWMLEHQDLPSTEQPDSESSKTNVEKSGRKGRKR